MECNDGYNLLGAESITCEAEPGHITGYWDRPVPVCKGKIQLEESNWKGQAGLP